MDPLSTCLLIINSMWIIYILSIRILVKIEMVNIYIYIYIYIYIIYKNISQNRDVVLMKIILKSLISFRITIDGRGEISVWNLD